MIKIIIDLEKIITKTKIIKGEELIKYGTICFIFSLKEYIIKFK